MDETACYSLFTCEYQQTPLPLFTITSLHTRIDFHFLPRMFLISYPKYPSAEPVLNAALYQIGGQSKQIFNTKKIDNLQILLQLQQGLCFGSSGMIQKRQRFVPCKLRLLLNFIGLYASVNVCV